MLNMAISRISVHESNFASVRIRFLNLDRTPNLWLAFFFFTLFTDMFANYKVYVIVNSEKPNVLSTFNDMSVHC